MSGPLVDPHEPAYGWGEHGARLGGLTKRQLIAAMAMQGLRASGHPRAPTNSDEVAAIAVADGDALLAELAKGDAA